MVRVIIGLAMIYISIGGLHWLWLDSNFRKYDKCSLHEYFTRDILAHPVLGQYLNKKGPLCTALIILDIMLIAAGPLHIIKRIITRR